MNQIKVFVASPGDVPDERHLFTVVIDELRMGLTKHLNINIEAIKWETHTWPDIGNDSQDVINRQIGEYDVFVGIMWRRFGTPTKRADSGTLEEFEKAFNLFKKFGRPKVMFYFKRKPFYTPSIKEIDQFKKVAKFRQRVTELGVLYSEYDESIEFERKFREHMTRQLFEFNRINEEKPKVQIHSPKVFISYKSQDFNRVEIIYEKLKLDGIDVWMDAKDILPGKNWRAEINDALLRADIEIVCITQNLIDKNSHSLTDFSVNNEVENANCYVLPVRLDNVIAPEYLQDHQWIDLFDLRDISKLIFLINKIWKELNVNNTQSSD